MDRNPDKRLSDPKSNDKTSYKTKKPNRLITDMEPTKSKKIIKPLQTTPRSTKKFNKTVTNSEKAKKGNLFNTKDKLKDKTEGGDALVSVLSKLFSSRCDFVFSRINKFSQSEMATQVLANKRKNFEMIDNIPNIGENGNFLIRHYQHLVGYINIKIKENFTLTVDISKIYSENTDTNLPINMSMCSEMNFAEMLNISAISCNEQERPQSFTLGHRYPVIKTSDVHERLANRKKKSPSEIARRIKEKEERVLQNKNMFTNQRLEKFKEQKEKLRRVQKQLKEEKKYRIERMSDKWRSTVNRYDKIIRDKVEKNKMKNEKIAEINFLNELEKKRKEIELENKFNLIEERRNEYLKEKVRKMQERNIREEKVEERRKQQYSELTERINRKIEKAQQNRDNLAEQYKNKYINKIFSAQERKKVIESKLNILKQMYQEDFIWDLMEADLFEFDDLTDLTDLTQMMITKKKLKKDHKKIIENIKNKLSNNGRKPIIRDDDSFTQKFLNYSEKQNSPKRSKTFFYFSEAEKNELMTTKPIKNERKLTKAMHCNSTTKINLTPDQEFKKFFVRSNSGRILDSQVLVKNFDFGEEDWQNNSMLTEGKEKLVKEIINKVNNPNLDAHTILLNSSSLTSLLESCAFKVLYCKLCNSLLGTQKDVAIHLNSKEHKALKVEHSVILQDDSKFIVEFITKPGSVSEELVLERLNTVKIRHKKLKQKLNLRAIKHEHFVNTKNEYQSSNKQRILKYSFDLEKTVDF